MGRIVLKNVTKSFGSTQVIPPLDLTIEDGEFTVFVGPSGCGKSTLLRMIAGLEAPSAGYVTIDGQAPAETLKGAGLSIAFQDPSLLPWKTVRQNIELALGLARRPKVAAEIDQLIHLVGLEGFGDTRPAALSGGMRQRAAIARALATKPALLLLDEPFGAVDELTRAQLTQDLPGIWEARGTTTLLVTHSVAEAVLLSDRVLVFSPRPAQIVADIPVALPRPRPQALIHDPAFRAITDQVFEALSIGVADNLPNAAQ